jgi:hypothetical protein
MKPGDQIEYITTAQYHGIVVGITGEIAEITIDSAGWLEKVNQVVPLAHVKTANPKVGGWANYTVKYTVTATVVTVYDSAVEVTPDYCAAMRSLISLDQIVTHSPGTPISS